VGNYLESIGIDRCRRSHPWRKKTGLPNARPGHPGRSFAGPRGNAA